MAKNDDIIKTEISQKLFVGIRDPKNEDNLGFLTYFDKDDAAFKKRKGSIERWAGREKGTYNYYDNVPTDGFKLVDFVTRYSTSNKLIEVVDPRGFKLQISIENILEIIENSVIDHGVIKEKCVWGRRKGGNVLVPIGSEMYKISQLEEVSAKDLKYLDRVLLTSSEEMIYFGHKYVIALNPVKITEKRRKTYYQEYTVTTGFKYEPLMLGKHHIFMFDQDSYLGARTAVDELNTRWKNYGSRERRFPDDPHVIIKKSVTVKGVLGNEQGKFVPLEGPYELSNNLKGVEYGAIVMCFDTEDEALACNMTQFIDRIRDQNDHQRVENDAKKA